MPQDDYLKKQERMKLWSVFFLIAVIIAIILIANARINNKPADTSASTYSNITTQSSASTAPASPVVTFNKDGSLSVVVPRMNDPLVSSYVLYRNTNNSVAHAVRSFSPDDILSYTDTDIKAGSTYTYTYIVNRSDGTSYPESKANNAKSSTSYRAAGTSSSTSSSTQKTTATKKPTATPYTKPTATPVPEKYARYGAHPQGGNLCWITDAALAENNYNAFSADFTYYKSLTPSGFQSEDQVSGLYYRSKWNYTQSSNNHTVEPMIVMISPSGKMVQIEYSSSKLSAISGSSSWEWVLSVEDHIDRLIAQSPNGLLESGTYTVQHYLDGMILNTSTFVIK